MTVAHDAATESATFTTTSPFTFNHTPSGTPRGVLVMLVSVTVANDRITSVSYGGVPMTRVGTAADTAGELGRAYLYFLGSGIPTGTQTVSIVHTGTETKIAWCVTVTAGGDTEVGASGVIEENAVDPQIALDTGANESLRYDVIYSGLSDPTNLTLLASHSAVHDHDFALFVARVDRQTTASTGSFTIGYTAATDDVAMVAAAIQEIPATPGEPPPDGWSEDVAPGTFEVWQSEAPDAAVRVGALEAALMAFEGEVIPVEGVYLPGDAPPDGYQEDVAPGTFETWATKDPAAVSKVGALAAAVMAVEGEYTIVGGVETPGDAPPAGYLDDVEPGVWESFRLKALADAVFYVALEQVEADTRLPEGLVFEYELEPGGLSILEFLQPDGTPLSGLPGAVIPSRVETTRVLNGVGSWRASISAYDHEVDGTPLAARVQRGWLVSWVQENNHPLYRTDLEYLMYRGVVEHKQYAMGPDGQALCEIEGSFRAIALSTSATPTRVGYDTSVSSIAANIEGGLAGGITVPSNGSGNVTMTFGGDDGAGVISRYARLLELGRVARYALRETWDQDALEFVRLDGAPDSGYVLVNQLGAAPSQSLSALAGFALVGDTPTVRYDGTNIVNRVIAFGSDFDGSPLTLQYASQTSPYIVQTGENPDGSFYFYLQDGTSIATFGAIELPLHNTSIRNPSDDSGTRQATADVLYALAAGTLLRNRSSKLFVEVPIANGSQVWALPGDKIKMEFSGNVLLDGNVIDWLELDHWFLVIERRDSTDPSGVRQVSLTLAAPELEIHLPGLPDAVVLPITEPTPGPGGGGPGTYPPGAPYRPPTTTSPRPPTGGTRPPGGPGTTLPDCCDDPSTEVTTSDPTYNPPTVTATIPGVTSEGPVGSGFGVLIPPPGAPASDPPLSHTVQFSGGIYRQHSGPRNTAPYQWWHDNGSYGKGIGVQDYMDPSHTDAWEQGQNSPTTAEGSGWVGPYPTWSDGYYMAWAENHDSNTNDIEWHWL